MTRLHGLERTVRATCPSTRMMVCGGGSTRKDHAVLESLEIVFGVTVAVLAMAVFAVMIWANLRVDGGPRLLG
jgi:hypothetical protein